MSPLFSDAEVTEDGFQQFVTHRFSGYFTDGIQSSRQVDGDTVIRHIGSKSSEGLIEIGQGLFQTGLVPWIGNK